MKWTILRVFLLSSVLYACTEGNENPKEVSDDSAIVESSDSTLIISQAGMDMKITLPKSSLTDEFKFEYRSSFGDILFYINENFHFNITQEDTPLSEVKEEFNQNGLFTYKFYDETDDELLFQTVLPDGTELGYNLIKRIVSKGKTYLVKSDSQAQFSREDIRRAQEILKKLN